MVLAFTLRSFTSTLLPVRTIGIFSQTRTRSPVCGCQNNFSEVKRSLEEAYDASWERSCM